MKGLVCAQYQNYRNIKKVFNFCKCGHSLRRTMILTKTTMAMMVMVKVVKLQNDVDVERQLCVAILKHNDAQQLFLAPY